MSTQKPKHYGENDPYQYALDNDLGPLEMNIVKYVTRHTMKGGKEDLLKARETLDRLIEHTYKDVPEPKYEYKASRDALKSGNVTFRDW